MAQQLQSALAILRRHQVEALTGLSRSSIYGLMAKDQFPKPVKLTQSGKAVGWRSDVIESWLRSREVTQ